MKVKKIEYINLNKKVAVNGKKGIYENDKVVFNVHEVNKLLDVNLTVKEGISFKYIRIYFEKENAYRGDMLANGFQSWSETKILSQNDKIKDLNFFSNKNRLEKYGDYHFYNHYTKTIIHSHEMTYLCYEDKYSFFGSLNLDNVYTVFEKDFKTNEFSVFIDLEGLDFNKGEKFTVAKIYHNSGSDLDKLVGDYYSNIDGPRNQFDSCTGWSTWQNYKKNINFDIVKKNMLHIKEYRLNYDYIIIDDGYEKEVGDWLDISSGFSNGMKEVASCIKEEGYEPGLWVNPFCCSENSKMYQDHREWIVKDANGNELISGVNDETNEKYYAVDFYNEDFRAYITKTFDTIINDWGFELIKLSNLYSVSILPRNNKTRAMIMSEALCFINDLAKDVKLLGTGVPMGPAVKKLDYCRVACNLNQNWKDKRNDFVGFRERASAYSEIHNMIYRQFMNHKAFSNASMTNVLHEESLDINQKHTLLFLNYILSDTCFFADNISQYNEEEIKLAKSIFPRKRPDTLIMDTIDKDVFKISLSVESKNYIAYVNISGNQKKIKLPGGMFFEKELGVTNNKAKIGIEPNQTRCFCKLDANENEVWLFTDGYIFPSVEVADFVYDDGDIKIHFIEGFDNKCNAFIIAKENIGVMSINGYHADQLNGSPINTWKASIK